MKTEKALQQVMSDFNSRHPVTLLSDKDIYANWLAQTYFFVRHSTSLLGFALPYLKNAKLKHHFEHHLSEEDRHDLLALKDLEKLGHSIGEFEESVFTQAFYHSQYYRISFEGGTSLLGYILFLEGLAVNWAKASYLEIKDQHRGATLFLKVHAEEDPTHVAEAIQTINALTPAEQKFILNNLKYSQSLYESILKDIQLTKAIYKAA